MIYRNVMTWNSEGGKEKMTSLRKLLNKNDVGVCCLQECGNGPGNPTGVQPTAHPGQLRIMEQQRNRDYYVYFYNWAGGGGRVNLAIMWDADLYTPSQADVDDHLRFVAPAFGGTRPLIGVAIDRCNTEFYSLHAISGGGGGNDVPRLLRDVKNNLALKNWMVGGDYNVEPNKWGGTKPTLPGNVCPPNGVTRPKSDVRYDYTVTTKQCVTGNVLENSYHADHYPVVYNYAF